MPEVLANQSVIQGRIGKLGVWRVMHAAQVRGQKPAEASDARSCLPHPRAWLFDAMADISAAFLQYAGDAHV